MSKLFLKINDDQKTNKAINEIYYFNSTNKIETETGSYVISIKSQYSLNYIKSNMEEIFEMGMDDENFPARIEGHTLVIFGKENFQKYLKWEAKSKKYPLLKVERINQKTNILKIQKGEEDYFFSAVNNVRPTLDFEQKSDAYKKFICNNKKEIMGFSNRKSFKDMFSSTETHLIINPMYEQENNLTNEKEKGKFYLAFLRELIYSFSKSNLSNFNDVDYFENDFFIIFYPNKYAEIFEMEISNSESFYYVNKKKEDLYFFLKEQYLPEIASKIRPVLKNITESFQEHVFNKKKHYLIESFFFIAKDTFLFNQNSKNLFEYWQNFETENFVLKKMKNNEYYVSASPCVIKKFYDLSSKQASFILERKGVDQSIRLLSKYVKKYAKNVVKIESMEHSVFIIFEDGKLVSFGKNGRSELLAIKEDDSYVKHIAFNYIDQNQTIYHAPLNENQSICLVPGANRAFLSGTWGMEKKQDEYRFAAKGMVGVCLDSDQKIHIWGALDGIPLDASHYDLPVASKDLIMGPLGCGHEHVMIGYRERKEIDLETNPDLENYSEFEKKIISIGKIPGTMKKNMVSETYQDLISVLQFEGGLGYDILLKNDEAIFAEANIPRPNKVIRQITK